jgi:hypothetical protein
MGKPKMGQPKPMSAKPSHFQNERFIVLLLYGCSPSQEVLRAVACRTQAVRVVFQIQEKRNATLFESHSQLFNVETNRLLLRVQKHIDAGLAFEFVEQLTGFAFPL